MTPSPAAQIFIELGQNTNTYATIANRQCANTTSYLGSLRKTVAAGNHFYLYANKNDNPPIYITGHPTNNNFLVSILTDQNAGYDNSSLGSYILTLYFEPV